MKRLLITGFEPFGGETINPAWESVKALPDALGNYTLYKREIPVLFGGAPGRVLEAAAEISPDGILCIGQAGGREAVTPERIAVNIRDAGIPDNGGMRPEGQRILEAGDAAYFATVPVEAMADAIRRAGLPGRGCPIRREPSSAMTLSIPCCTIFRAVLSGWALSMCPISRNREAPA